MDRHDSQESRSRFVDLLHEHQRIVSKVSSVYAAGTDGREDLSQEIVMQLWRAWPSFRGDSSFATWAFRVALNTALFQRRKAARDRGHAADGDPHQIAAPRMADPMETKEAVELLYECIRTLRELDRAIVLMHLEARPHAEIAEFTGLSTGNVTVRLHRIKKSLRECLAARGHVEETTP